MKFILIVLLILTEISCANEHEHDHDKHKEVGKEKNSKVARELKANEHNYDAHDEYDKHDKHDEHEEDGDKETTKAVGEGKAIESFSAENGLVFSKQALDLMKISYLKVESSSVKIPAEVFVTFQAERGVYRKRGEFFKFIDIKILRKIKGFFIITSAELKRGDEIATSSLDLIRISDAYSSTELGGHSH